MTNTQRRDYGFASFMYEAQKRGCKIQIRGCNGYTTIQFEGSQENFQKMIRLIDDIYVILSRDGSVLGMKKESPGKAVIAAYGPPYGCPDIAATIAGEEMMKYSVLDVGYSEIDEPGRKETDRVFKVATWKEDRVDGIPWRNIRGGNAVTEPPPKDFALLVEHPSSSLVEYTIRDGKYPDSPPTIALTLGPYTWANISYPYETAHLIDFGNGKRETIKGLPFSHEDKMISLSKDSDGLLKVAIERPKYTEQFRFPETLSEKDFRALGDSLTSDTDWLNLPRAIPIFHYSRKSSS